MKGLTRAYLTPEAKREAKKRAADLDLNLIDYFDKTFLGNTKKERKKRGFDFGF